MYRGKRIAVVVPAYNEELLVRSTLEGIPAFVDRIYAINDGSADSTYDIIVQRSKEDERVVPIDHKVNRGVGAALITGYKRSMKDGMDITAVMAGDDQMDPRYLPALLDPIVEGRADYSKGNRLADVDYVKGMSAFRLLGNAVLTLLTKLSTGFYNINDPQNGYTAMSNEVFETIDPDSIFPWYGYCNDILMRLKVHGFRVVDVPIPARYGKERSSIPYPMYVARLSRLLLVNFILRLGMKKALLRPRRAPRSTVTGTVLIAIGGAAAAMPGIAMEVSQTDITEGLVLITIGTGIVLVLYGHLINMASKKFEVPSTR